MMNLARKPLKFDDWYRNDLHVVPCFFHKKVHPVTGRVYYVVQIHLLIEDNLQCYAFLHSLDSVENMLLAREMGVNPYNTSVYVVVNELNFPSIYRQIVQYECAIAPTLSLIPISDVIP